MFNYKNVLLPFWAAIFCYLAFDIEEESSMLEGLSVQIIPSASNPWLIFWYGVGIGLFVIPWIIDWIERGKEYEKFYSEVRDFALGNNRSKFFMYLSRAYEEWKKDYKNAPQSIENLIEEASYPDWLPALNGELLDKIKTEFISGSNPPFIWLFSYDLYTQIDEYIKKRTPIKLLTEEEAIEFHQIRQVLSYFWDSAAHRTLIMGKLKFRNIRPLIKPEKRLLKMIVYLSLALHLINNQEGQGSKHLYYLCGIYFKTKKWGLKESIWNPLQSLTDNLRN